MTRRIALVLEYEGTGYAGFQLQPVLPTIQGALEAAIERLTGQHTRVHGAGRTDAGVHAQGQVAAFDLHTDEGSLAIDRFMPGLNHYLPDDIAVLAAYGVSEAFDPRRHATARVYRYTFVESRGRSPLRSRLVHQVGRPLDVEVMRQAAATLEGERDFAPFCGQLPESGVTTRRMERAAVWRDTSRAQDEVVFEMEANAFLNQQVRRTAAAVLDVGLGRTTVEAFATLAASAERGVAAQVAPARGLCLRQVRYVDFPPLATAISEGVQEMVVR